MNDHDLDQFARLAVRRSETEPDLWPRLRPQTVRRPSLFAEALTCALGGACALAALWLFAPGGRDAYAPSVSTTPPALASSEERAVAGWLATGRYVSPAQISVPLDR